MIYVTEDQDLYSDQGDSSSMSAAHWRRVWQGM